MKNFNLNFRSDAHGRHGSINVMSLCNVSRFKHVLDTKTTRTRHELGLYLHRYVATLLVVLMVGFGQAWGTAHTISPNKAGSNYEIYEIASANNQSGTVIKSKTTTFNTEFSSWCSGGIYDYGSSTHSVPSGISANWLTASTKGAKIRGASNTYLVFEVTNCVGVAVLGKAGGSGKELQISVKASGVEVGSVASSSTTSVHELSYGTTLSASTTYTVTVKCASTGDNSEFYQIRFEAPSASTKRIYMEAANGWNNSTPYFYAKSWGVTGAIVLMTQVSTCETNMFYADIPSGDNNILFTRQSTNSGIKYKDQDGCYNQSVDINCTSNDKFTFNGTWDKNSTGKSDFNYGTYSAPTYTVTYNKNGDGAGGAGDVTGSVPTDSNSPYSCGDDVTVLGNTGSLALTGYSFNDWNTAANGTGDPYSANDTYEDIAANTTFYAQWTREAPTSVSVTGDWAYFPGQTISITAVPTGGTSDFTYQWQKYIGSTWTNLTNGTSDGVTISGATSANLQISGCKKSNAGSYRCKVSKAGLDVYSDAGGTAKNIKIYTLDGNYTGESFESNNITYSTTNTGTVTLSLTANSVYEFKIIDNFESDIRRYGNESGNYIISPVTFGTCYPGDLKANIRLFTGPAGDYTFTVNIAHVGDNSPYVSVSVAYPSVTHPAAGYAYFEKPDGWTNVYLYWYTSDSYRMTNWEGAPELITTTEICGKTYYYAPISTVFSNVIYKGNGTNRCPKDGYTVATSGCSGKWLDKNDYETCTWTAFTYYGITFAANGSDGGTAMTNVSNICPSSDVSLAANTLTKTGHSFSGWKTNAALTYVAYGDADDGTHEVSAAVNDIVPDKAKIKVVGSNITLTAQWTADTYDVTTSLTNVTVSSGTTGTGAATYGSAYMVTLQGATGYNLPTTVTVTIGGSPATLTTDYTWNSSTGELTVLAAKVTGNISITASGAAQTYSITYKDQGGSAFSGSHADGYPTTHTYGSSTTLKTASKTGYTFDGWYGNSACTADPMTSIGATSITADITLYAKWTIKTYTVTFASNNGSYGSVSPTSIASVPHGSEVSIVSNVLTLEETEVTATATTSTSAYTYAFSSWSVSNGAGITEAQTITATFTRTANSYDVTLTYDGDEISKESGASTATYGTNYVATFEAKSGYTLQSDVTVVIGESTATKGSEYTWAISEGVGTLTITGSYITDDITVTVGADADVTYTVTYEYNGATGDDDTENETGASVTLPTPTRTDYTFDGWYTTDGTEVGDGGDTYNPTADITLYARWKTACAAGSTTTLSWFETSAHTPSSSKPDSESRYCYGYTNSAKTSGYAYTLTTDYANSAACGTANEDLYLHYGNHWNIYADNTTTGGTPTTFSNVTSFSLKVKLRKDAPTMTITIGGTTIANAVSLSEASTSSFKTYTYSDLSNLSGKITITNNGSGSTNYDIYIDDITITTAGGGGTCYHVYYHGNGAESGFVNDTLSYTSGSKATVLGNVRRYPYSRTGYTFNGWNTKADGSGTSFAAGDQITMAKDTVLYAKWTAAVCSAPVITSEPSNDEVEIGEEATLSLTATGSDLSYQWYQCLSDGSNMSSISGATSSSYSVTPSEVGTKYYRCIVSDCDPAKYDTSAVAAVIATPNSFTVHYEAGSTDGTTYNIDGTTPKFTVTKEVDSDVSSYIGTLTDFAFTGTTVSDKGKKGTMSMKISMPTSEDADKYVSFGFTVADDYYLEIDSIDIRCQPVGYSNHNYKIVLTDELGTTITGTSSTNTKGELNRIPFTSGALSGKKLVGDVTVKIFGWYSSSDTYRLAKDSYIYGKVSSLPRPVVSWDSHPNSAMVGDGGKTYSVTTDATNTIAWTIEDQEGATSAALTGSGASRTLGSYSTAGSLYVQASVTGDGQHYNSAATVLRQYVTISPSCGTTVLIRDSLTGKSNSATVTGTPGGTNANSTSDPDANHGYKLGSNGNYVRATLTSGNFAAGDVLSIVITKASDVGTGKLYVYKYMSSTWTKLDSITATSAGTHNYTIKSGDGTFDCIGLYRESKNQNPYIKEIYVSRNDCAGSLPSSVSISASASGPYDIDDDVTLTCTATGATSYQWYSNSENSTSDGSIIEGKTSTTYSPSTASAGTVYYYCVATNSYGSTASNVLTVTVNSSKTDPTADWTDTDESPVYGGGGYDVKVVAKNDDGSDLWDGTLTTDMLAASTGVTLSNVTVNNTTKTITAKYGVTEAATSPITFTLTLPESTNHNAAELSFDDATFTTCSGSGGGSSTTKNIRMRSTVSKVGNYYYCANTDGWISANPYSSHSTAKSDTVMVTVFDTVASSNTSSVYIRPYDAGVKSVRIYANFRVDNMTVSKVYKHTDYFKAADKYEVSATIQYNGDADNTDLGTDDFGYVDITLSSAMAANDILLVTFSDSRVRPLGAVVTIPAAGGDGTRNQTTTISWATTPGSPVTKDETDADFRFEATRSGNANATASLGAITYRSSNTSLATVNATTGVVTIADNIDFGEADYKGVTIYADLAASGCFKAHSINYTVRISPSSCEDAAGTITATSEAEGVEIDGNTVNKGACDEVTLTVSGHLANDGVTYQWYKNGETISGNGASIDVIAAGDYTVEVTNSGDGHCTMPATNTITVNAASSVSITPIVDSWYVKNGRRTPDIALATIDGTSSYTVNDGSSNITTFAGCGFVLRDGTLYLKGTTDAGAAPSGLTSGDVTLTITAVDACGGEDADTTIVIHKQTATAKPTVAFVVDGTKGSTDVAAAKTSERAIWTFLSESFTLTGCNAYWTNDEKTIKQYYSQFDAIVITDDPSTDTKPSSGKKYVDALGAMVDIRPILTMEAYVGKYGSSSNWHIGATPSSPDPREYEMKLQCKDHEIFDGMELGSNFRRTVENGLEYYHVMMVDESLSPYKGTKETASKLPALQGFSTSAMEGTDLLGIGTIKNGTLQGGIERQVEPAARMIILGINHQAMSALTTQGKTVIKNAVDYLLKTNMEDVDDCSNFFLGTTSSDWGTASNWSAGKLPDHSTKVRIMAPVTISDATVRVSQVDIVTGGSSKHIVGTPNGSLTIAADGALIVEGKVRQATAPNFSEDKRFATTSSILSVEADADGNGALILDNEEGDTQASVQMYSKANTNQDDVWNWQYVGTPHSDVTNAMENYYNSYLYKWDISSQGWESVVTGGSVEPWVGYCITHPTANHTYYMQGTLTSTEDQSIAIPANKEAVLANSWTAPIYVNAFTDADFGNLTKTIYLFNTGSDTETVGGTKTAIDAKAGTTAGTYVAVPIHAAPYTGDSLISSMQGFFLYNETESEETLKLNYSRLVRPTGSRNVLSGAMHAPRRFSGIGSNKPVVMKMWIAGNRYADKLVLLEREDFSRGFDDGWDGTKMGENEDAPAIWTTNENGGKESVMATDQLEGTVVGFQAGEDNEYTFYFEYDENAGPLYLNDLKTQTSALIQNDNTYRFATENGDSANRFYISATPIDVPQMPTGFVNPNAEAPKVQKIIYNDKMYIIRSGRVYSADGALVK